MARRTLRLRAAAVRGAAEGRMLWGNLIRYSRDFVRLAASYTQRDLCDRAARYVQVRGPGVAPRCMCLGPPR